MRLVSHRLYGQLMWGLYTKWVLSPTRLVFWVVFSYLVCNRCILCKTIPILGTEEPQRF
ncbi:hypothetical protein Hanom_Chr05g00467311 [Helianthus anomalus]